MGPEYLKRRQLFVSNDDANPSEQFKDGVHRFWQLSECPERTLIFFLLIVSFLWQEHQALKEKSESTMTTVTDELTMN
jgi:hypothetical protein